MPYNAEDYVHRIGRTGRAGASGDAISLYTDKDARLLVDIEKLIKHTIAKVELAGFVPQRSSERERRPRREETESGAVPAPSQARASYGRSSGGYGARKEKIDPWFLKPYEPEQASIENGNGDDRHPGAKPKAKVAALLGGIPKR